MDSNSELINQHDKGFIDDESMASLNQPQAPSNQDAEWKKLVADCQDHRVTGGLNKLQVEELLDGLDEVGLDISYQSEGILEALEVLVADEEAFIKRRCLNMLKLGTEDSKYEIRNKMNRLLVMKETKRLFECYENELLLLLPDKEEYLKKHVIN